MASVAVETTADTSAATSAVHPPLAPALPSPPIPPPRSLLNRNTQTEKSLSGTSKSNNSTDILAMATKQETSTTVSSHSNVSSTPSPPPPPADFQAITSPLPPDLPPPPEFYTSSSPPPPPPPPSYLFPELSLEDLPPPPPPQLFMDMESQPLPMYICSYDPPSPEIKSEYDPKLPPGFSVKYKQNPFSPSPPPVPPPPRPTPPPPPTPPVRQASKENLAIPAHTSANDETLSTQTVTNASSSGLYLASAEDTQTKDSLDGTSCNYPKKSATDTHMSTDDSVYGRPVSSGLSSSTLTASLLLTPESGLSPLPPHALRVSPVPTDVNTSNSSQVTDDLTITSASSDTASTPYIFDSRDSTFDIDTPEVTPQLSEILGIHSPTPNEVKMNSIMDEILAGKDSLSDVTPQLSEISGTHSPTPTEEEVNSVNIEIKIDAESVASPEQVPSPIMISEISTASGPDSSESERNEDSTGIDSTSEQTDYSLTEKADTDIVGGSLTVTSTTEVAQMSSPFSTEPPSLFSLPTDSDTLSADFDSLAADTLSPTADFESYSGDAETSTINSIAITRAADMFLTSSSGFSDTAYASADSNMESATMSPAFTESCTITPMPSDFVTPMSTNPTTTPVPSPIPSSPLPYFDAIPPEAMSLSQLHTSSINPCLSAMVTSSSSRMLVSSSEHHTEFQSKISNTQKSILEDVVQLPPASRAKTPPLPPPRSCMNTPRLGVGAPLPPPRQYMLIPINSSQRRHSPPPAPPRSTSIRKSPPPPPPRSAVHTPAAKNEWIDFPPLPPPPTSAINTPSTPPKLTPVPEESSFPCTPLPPKDSPQESSLPNTTPSPTCRKSPCWTVPVSECDNALTSAETPTYLELPSVGEEIFFHRSLYQPTESDFSTAVNESLSSTHSISNTPPALPPMPEEDTEEEPPPPPPPPVEFEDEHLPTLPLPPPPESLISPPPLPPPPNRSKIATSPLPPKIDFSPEVCPLKKHLSASNSLENANQSSIPLASDTATNSSDPPAMSLPAASPATEAQGVPVELAPIMPSSAPSLVPPPPPPPQMPVPSPSQISSHPPPPRCLTPQSSKATPNSALWTVSPYGKVVINRNDLPLPSPEEEIRKTFYNVKNWGLLEYSMDTLAVYTQLRPNIQMGPQCGLVALSMASQVFPETKEIADLLKDATEQRFTSHGEMFSSENMAKLANGISGMEATVRRDVLCDPKTLLELLIHGNLILVPYDADQNHMPNLRNGHKAHWGILCGCLVQCESLSMLMGGTSKLDARVDNLWHMRPRSRRGVAASRDGSLTPSTPIIPSSPRLGQRIPRTPEVPALSLTSDGLKTPDASFPEISTGRTTEIDTLSVCSSRVNTPMIPEILNDDIRMVVLWRQGKSRSLIAAPLEKLCESNDQLLEYPSPSNEVESEFIIGSVQDGLAGQVVVLHKTKTALSDLVGILQDKEECM